MTSTRFQVAALLNISADHFDRHGGLDGYVAAKRYIFDRQQPGDAAVVGIDDAPSRSVADELERRAGAKVIRVSAVEPPAGGVGARGSALVDATDGATEATVELGDIETLPGAHNRQNAAAAYAICRQLGLDAATIAEAIRGFRGLPHRQEPVRRIGDVLFVNDSKGTNTDATARALASYDCVYWIAGGQAKDGGFESLRPYLPRIAGAFLIGQAAEAIAQFLDGAEPRVQYLLCDTLDRAVATAWRHARHDRRADEKVVLLSPACASFDQFPNFGARGDAFRALVANLPVEPDARAV